MGRQQGTRSRTQRLARWVVRHRRPVGAAIAAATLGFAYPVANALATAFGAPLPGPRVRVDTRARDLFPDHPYIRAHDAFAPTFGGASLVVVVVAVEDGTIFRPDALRALDAITRELDGTGFAGDAALYPVDHDRVRSLTHPSTRSFEVGPDGAVRQDVLVGRLPETPAEAEALRERARRSAPALFGRLVSRDGRAALVSAAFVTDRLSGREVHAAVFDHVQGIRERWEARVPGLRVFVSGEPIERGWILAHAGEVAGFVLASLAAMFGLLWLYFRSWHGVAIPALAAGTTALWGLGFTGWAGIPFDPLILVIPMLITARAVSHTVQMAERFFEEYAEALPRAGDARRARDEAARGALAELAVPGTLGVVTDVAGLLVILLTTIPQMRHLAVFGAFWVAAIVVTVEILHPVLICSLPPPRLPRGIGAGEGLVGRFTAAAGALATHPRGRYAVAGATLALLVASVAVALARSQIGEASAGTPLLWPGHEYNRATAEVAARFGGVDALRVFLDGDRPQASADAAPLAALERFARAQADATPVGATTSLAPLVRELWRRNHYGDPKWAYLPGDSGTVRSLIFQLRQDGPPGFLRPYLSDDGRDAVLTFFYPDHRGETVSAATRAAERWIAANPLGEVSIRLDRDRAAPGASWLARERWLDAAWYALGPLLPERHHTLRVRVRDASGAYAEMPVRDAARDGPPAWLGAFRDAIRPAPAWTREDAGQWWEDERRGLRALEVSTGELWVQDLRAVESAPQRAPTGAWTRGVQFVMAGGSLGVLAAIHEEVERSHVANLSLILFAIVVLHSLTYRSLASGGIVGLQLATATAISLAFMALRGVGLNVHTLPVQAVGIGIGVDYAIYVVDRIRREAAACGDLDAAVRRAVATSGRAVTFTATTIAAGVALWVFSELRFQAEMAYLLVMLMGLNGLGAVLVVPAFYAILRPGYSASK